MSSSSSVKIALVTGASRGIGKAIAIELGKQKDITVIGTATSKSGADGISGYLEESGIKGQGVVMDITNQESIDKVISMVNENYGAINILVNNAGITADNLFLRMKDEEWDKVIDANLSGVYRTVKACIRSMIKSKWGRIVNISSIVGISGNPGQANYCAAKAGVIGFTKSLAKEIATRGITVNVVAPGFIATDMTSQLPEASKSKLLEQIPMGRIGEAKDIANAVKFLTSDDAGYITGETINVNGGMLMD